MNLEKNLRERCFVCENSDGDNFVGVKADTDDAAIYFPIGYQLPESDDQIRLDVQKLFDVLSIFMKEDRVIEAPKFVAPRTVDFPIHAYLHIITEFLRTGGHYYVESDPEYRTNTRGNTSWPRTVKDQRAFVQKNGALIFTQMTVRTSTPNQNKQITQIHRYCVYEAFEKLGWLYVSFMPQKPGPHPGEREAIAILNSKLASSHNDREQRLFTAMIHMLQFIDLKNEEKQYFFGTDHFDKIWEKMIDKAFGISAEEKREFFPKTRWLLDYKKDKEKRPLIPDTVMVYNGKYYVLDAKYYRYGWTADADHLPNGTDINKQITYGEYLMKKKSLPDENLYNAFIMPYNKFKNKFGINGTIENVGEAVGEWKSQIFNYERIQGILIDVRYLMYNYVLVPPRTKLELTEAIEKKNNRGAVPEPQL